MNQNLIANVLSLTLFTVSLFITLRAFYLYLLSHRQRLFILGLSMAIIALTAIASFIGDNVPSFTINLNWFKYTSQTVSFLFILLSLVRSSDRYLRSLMIWHILVSVLLLILLTPFAPAEISTTAKIVLGSSRSLICLLVFFYYVTSFMKKETFFSLMMSLAFLLLSVGYVLNVPKYSNHLLTLLDNIGDVVRISGLIVMLVTVLIG
jgi:uncharacterized membrane protein YhdT